MIDQALIVGGQILAIYIYITIGIVCVKKKIFSKDIGKALSAFSLSVVTPCVIINSFQQPFSAQILKNVGLSFLLALISHVIFTIIALVLIKKRGDSGYKIERLAIIFSNCGYMGIPLIQAVLGSESVIYASAYITFFNIVLWSLGVIILSPGKKMSIKNMLVNPGTFGMVVGLAMYILKISLPSPVKSAVNGIAQINTPMAMVTIGIFLAGINIKSMLKNMNIYKVNLYRLVLAPIIVILIYRVFNISNWYVGAQIVVMANILASACPTAAAATLFPAKMGVEGESYGAEIIAISTIISLITLPLTYLAAAAFL